MTYKQRAWALRPTKGELTLVDLYHVDSGETLGRFSHPYMAEQSLAIAQELGDNYGLPLTDRSWKNWSQKYQRRIHSLAQVVPCPTPGCPGKKAGRVCRRPSDHTVTGRGGLQDVHGKRLAKFDIWLEKQLPKKHHRKGKRSSTEHPCPVNMHQWLQEGVIEGLLLEGTPKKPTAAAAKKKTSTKRKLSPYNLHMKEKMGEGYSFQEAVGLWKLKKVFGNPRKGNPGSNYNFWSRFE